MIDLPLDFVKDAHDAFERPVWADPPRIVVQAHPDRHEAVREAFAAEFGPDAPLALCSSAVELPPKRESPSGRRVRDCARATDETADLALVESGPWVGIWQKAGHCPVYTLDDPPEAA